MWTALHLEMGMHLVMNSTSPGHEGWQTWNIFHPGKHGDFSGGLEKSISNEKINQTLDLMNATLGGDSCACTR